MENHPKPAIVLASASIGRRGLLTQFGEPFDVMVSDINEEAILDSDPVQMLAKRAKAKAEIVSEKLIKQTSPYLIIAADSSAIVNNKIYGKVKNKIEAAQMIRALMGKTHQFVTATTIILLNNSKVVKCWDDNTSSYVSLRKMGKEEIEAYLSRYDFSKFAACYTLNETPWDWITKIDGSFTNVIGLPFEILLPILREVGII